MDHFGYTPPREDSSPERPHFGAHVRLGEIADADWMTCMESRPALTLQTSAWPLAMHNMNIWSPGEDQPRFWEACWLYSRSQKVGV